MRKDEFVKQIQNLRNKRTIKATPAKIVERTPAGVVRIPTSDAPHVISISKTVNTVHKIKPTTKSSKGGCGCGRKKR